MSARDRQRIFVARRRVEELADELPHRGALVAKKVIDLGEDEPGDDDQARGGQDRFVFWKARGSVGGAGERPKQPARIRDDWRRHSSRSRNNIDSSPSLVSVDSNNRVDGERRPA